MERHRPYIFDSTQHDVELSRLRALENIYDSATRRFLLTAGVRPGWRCLEVGAGAGSIANWLSEMVGPAGHVLAVDVNTRFLSVASATNLDVRETDIRTASVEAASFDVAHTRFVLVHIYGGVGLAFQDTIAVWHIYQAARHRGIGKQLDFLA